MASPSGTKSALDSYLHDHHRASLSEASTVAGTYRDSFDDDDEERPDFASEKPAPGVLERMWQAMTTRRRKLSQDFFSAGSDLPDGLLRKPRRYSRHASPREARVCRRSYPFGLAKRLLLASPFLILIAFGILHIAQALIGGREPLFWDVDEYDEFLPDWGKPGQPGDGLADYPTDATRDVTPIRCHSHNDYWRRVPLFEAIHWGCTGVEADVWLFDEELYVGHNTAALTKNRTFRNLYVTPLVNLLDQMNARTEFADHDDDDNSNNHTRRTAAAAAHGVFDADPNQTLVLLVDLKTNGHDTFPYLSDQLSALREKDYLSYWDGTQLQQRAVTVVGTGNTPFDLVVQQNATRRDIFFDAPLDHLYEGPATTSPTSPASSPDDDPSASSLDLPSPRKRKSLSPQGSVGTELAARDDFNPSTSYYASVSFTHAVGFVWRGRLSRRQLDRVRGQIRGAHRRGLKVRYWDTPGWPVGLRNHVWHVLMKEGVDVLNVDDLKAAAVENWKARVHGFW